MGGLVFFHIFFGFLGFRGFGALYQARGIVTLTVESKMIGDRLFLRAIDSNYRDRSVRPEEVISITETDLWNDGRNISHYRYRLTLEFRLICITDTDFGLETN